MNKNHLNLAVNEAKTAFEQIGNKVANELAEERGSETPTDTIVAKALTTETFKAAVEE